MNRRWMGVVGLVALLAIVAAACNNNNEPAGGGASGATSSTGTSPTPSFTTLVPGELKVASCLDYKPFESVPPGGQPTGFDVELTEAIASKLGLKVQWVKTGFGPSIFSGVAANQFDMVAAAVTITPKRSQTDDFSDPYFDSDQSLTVNTTKTPDITTTDGLQSGDAVAVQANTTGAMWATENLQPRGIEVKTFPEVPSAFNDLQAGTVQGVINDFPSSLAEVKTRPGLKVVQTIPTGEHYGFAFSPSNPGLREAWNQQLAAAVADGTYATIFMKYFPGIEIPAAYQPG
jgi:polar amino acid transport system substrate-binding protein